MFDTPTPHAPEGEADRYRPRAIDDPGYRVGVVIARVSTLLYRHRATLLEDPKLAAMAAELSGLIDCVTWQGGEARDERAAQHVQTTERLLAELITIDDDKEGQT